jgi:hypothetical protein
MHLGDAELGFKTVTSMIRQFEDDEHQGIFYLTAGAMLSSMGKHEQAGQYYFEAIQIGAPKFFSKSDLMFILSRSFEQLGFETKASGSDPVEEGYVMVRPDLPSPSPPPSLTPPPLSRLSRRCLVTWCQSKLTEKKRGS